MKKVQAKASAPTLIERIEANIHERAALEIEFRELTEGKSLRSIIGDFTKHLVLDESSAIPLLREKVKTAEARKAALALIPRKLAKQEGLVLA